MYSRQIKEGDPYKNLPHVISIVILAFCLFCKLPQLLNPFYLTAYHAPEYVFSEALQIYALETTKEKIDQIRNYPKPLQRWLIFFYYSNKKTEEEMKVLIKGDPAVETAYGEYQKFCEDDELRRLDDARQQYMHDYASDIDAAYTKGKSEGKREGKLDGLAEGEVKGQVNSILTLLKTNLKKQVPQHIVDALQTRTDLIALESLLITAARCRSFEEFEKELK